MNFPCFICFNTFDSIYNLIKHLRSFHYIPDGPNLYLKCAFLNCGLVFRTYSGFRKHLYTHDKQNNVYLVPPQELNCKEPNSDQSLPFSHTILADHETNSNHATPKNKEHDVFNENIPTLDEYEGGHRIHRNYIF